MSKVGAEIDVLESPDSRAGSDPSRQFKPKLSTRDCSVGDGDWLVHNVELNTDCGFVHYQTQQHRVNLQLAKLTRTVSVTTSCGVRVHEFHRRSHLSVVATLVLPVPQMV